MIKINWLVRIKHKAFWLAIVPAFLVLMQVIAVPFGYHFEIGKLSDELINIVNAVFVLLSILGIVVDPTTDGLNDSQHVLTKQTKSDQH